MGGEPAAQPPDGSGSRSFSLKAPAIGFLVTLVLGGGIAWITNTSASDRTAGQGPESRTQSSVAAAGVETAPPPVQTNEAAEVPSGARRPARGASSSRLAGAGPLGPADIKVVGSPFNMPSFVVSRGQPLTVMRPRVETEISRLCGTPAPCVKIVTVKGADEFLTECQFDTTAPAAGTPVKPGSTVKMITGKLPCYQTDEQTTTPDSPEEPPSPPTGENDNGGSNTPPQPAPSPAGAGVEEDAGPQTSSDEPGADL